MSTLTDFLGLLAAECKWTLSNREENIEVKPQGKRPVRIELEAEGQQVSHNRLLFVEKQAAIALLSDVADFAVSVTDPAWKRNRKVTLVRIAFGFYIVNARRCFQRYTGYYDRGSNLVALLLGDDSVFSDAINIVQLKSSEVEFRGINTKIVSLVQTAYQHYVVGKFQTQEFRTFAKCQRDRFFELDLLYRRRSREHIRTFGVDLSDTKSRPASADDEFQRRRLDVMSRCIPKVAVKILSIGVVVSPVKGRDGQYQMPFTPGPTDSRWLIYWKEKPNNALESKALETYSVR